jgi:hypothetical protein
LPSRQETDQESPKPHNDDGHREHRLAPDSVAEMPEDRGTQWPSQEADGVGAKRRDGAQRRIGQRKEELVEDECSRRTVDQEIVPLDRSADDT